MRLDLDAFRAGGRRCGGSRRAIILSALFITLLFFLLLSSSSSPVTASVIVSIATSSARLDRELPVTLRSLLSQTVEPTEIRVHFALDDRAEVEAKLDEGRLGRLFFHPLVKRYYVEDIGPGSKYTYVLMDLIRRAATGEPWLANMPVVIADDDHSYSPYMLSTLLDAHAAMPDASVGLRGWRVRDDLQWGVPIDRYLHHVQHGHLLPTPYRVSVLTANEGYLLTTRMLSRPATHRLFYNRTALATSSAHLVDDITMAGALSESKTERYVVPLKPSWARPNVDVTKHHTLEQHMALDGTDRAEANNVALRMYEDAWREEGLWYDWEARAPPLIWFGVRWWRKLRSTLGN